MDDTTALKNDFLTEAKEHLDSVEEDILQIEGQGEHFNEEILNRLFRAMHSIKGGSAFLNLSNITSLSHALENVIGSIRNKRTIPNAHIADLLLKGVDKLKSLVYDINNESRINITKELSDIEQILTSPVLRQEDEKAAHQPEHRVPLEKSADQKPQPLALNPAKEEIPVPTISQSEEIFYYNYEVSIDLVTQCDDKQISLEDFFNNLYALGTVTRVDFDPAASSKPDSLIFCFVIQTVIDDQNVLMETLDVKPLSIKKTLVKSDTAKEQKPQINIQLVEDKEDDSAPVPPDVKAAEAAGNPSLTQDALVTEKIKPVEKKAISASQPGKSPTLPSLNKDDSSSTDEKHSLTKSSGSSSIRIPLVLLDKLMNYASELVLVRNQNMQAVDAGDLEQLRAIGKKLNVVTSGLQAGILQTRMQPVDIVFSKFTRIVRDLSKKLEKEVNLQIVGKDVELDKNIIEALGDPLTHLIRNCVDHGIESPSTREACGKPRCGRILMGAYHKAGQVNIIIEDDGKGMNPAKLIESALNKGVITDKRAASMSDEDALNLIFLPGFSTAGEVTDLSGRGVGMDVVKTNLQSIGGVIYIRSKPGVGTSFDIRLPLTLTIMHALVVLVEDICFAIPEFNISEIVRLYGEDIYKNVKKVNDQQIFSLRGKLIPVIKLAEILQIKKTFVDPQTNEKREERRSRIIEDEEDLKDLNRRTSIENSIFIVILNLGNIQYGLIIDTIIDTEEIVIKPLHEQVKKCKAYAGTTVLGDGRIAIILDIANLAELANFNINKIESINKKEAKVIDDKQTVITFDIGGKETFAIHLFLISHIEKIDRSRILCANNKEYFKFQESVIRLIRIESALESVKADYKDELFVIIIKGKRPIGILVSRIIDTTMVSSNSDFQDTQRPGVIGVLMLNQVLTMVLDIFAAVEIIEPGWFYTRDKSHTPRKVLLLEDTKFYASLIISYLSSAGMDVTHAHNGKEGIELLDTNHFDIVISDLVMPVMDGFEFARYLRSIPKYKNITLIAISAAYDAGKGREIAVEAGFDEYVSKLDREGMLECFKRISKTSGEI